MPTSHYIDSDLIPRHSK